MGTTVKLTSAQWRALEVLAIRGTACLSNGTEEGVRHNFVHRRAAQSLQDRGLATIRGRWDDPFAEITDAGLTVLAERSAK